MGRYSTSLDIGKELEKEPDAPPMNPAPENEEQKTLDDVKTGEDKSAEEFEKSIQEEPPKKEPEKAKEEVTAEKIISDDDEDDPDAHETTYDDQVETEDDINNIMDENGNGENKEQRGPAIPITPKKKKSPLLQIAIIAIVVLIAVVITWNVAKVTLAPAPVVEPINFEPVFIEEVDDIVVPEMEETIEESDLVEESIEEEPALEQPVVEENVNADDILGGLGEQLKD